MSRSRRPHQKPSVALPPALAQLATAYVDQFRMYDKTSQFLLVQPERSNAER